MNNSGDVSYWNDFYGSATIKQLATPSQFAVFTLGEMDGRINTIIDCGCGSGRDTFFFMSRGMNVVGIDASQVGVEHCKLTAQSLGFNNSNFICSAIDDTSLENKLLEITKKVPCLVYARFFIHAINDYQEEAFLKLAKTVCGNEGLLAVEFRTPRDAMQSKATPEHFRRFVNPLSFLSRTQDVGFRVSYFVEGFGYAKYKKDDAYVARCILRSN